MVGGLINGIPVQDILHTLPVHPELVERIAQRKVKQDIAIVECDPQWPAYFETFRWRILNAFKAGGECDGRGEGDGDKTSIPTILSVEHVGSTSVPGLPAKAVIDIDLVLSSVHLPSDEEYYVPRLERAGFQYLLREPGWYEHRFFVASPEEPIACNLHVFGPRCAMVERHRVFRDWLREHEEDRKLYARVKRECVDAVREKEEGLHEYTERKNGVVQEIMGRACQQLDPYNLSG